jgi:hypothetical protein
MPKIHAHLHSKPYLQPNCTGPDSKCSRALSYLLQHPYQRRRRRQHHLHASVRKSSAHKYGLSPATAQTTESKSATRNAAVTNQHCSCALPPTLSLVHQYLSPRLRRGANVSKSCVYNRGLILAIVEILQRCSAIRNVVARSLNSR